MFQVLRQQLPTALMYGLMLSCFVLFASPALAASEAALVPYKLSYAATMNGMDINAERELRVIGDSFEMVTSAKNLLGSITEEGRFKLDEQGVIVDQGYEYERNIIGMKKTEELSYDRNSGVANYETKKKKRQVKLDGNYLNRLSYQVQLQRDLIRGESDLQYQVIARGRLKDYNFEILGEETLDTPLGPFKTIKVRRVREDDDRQTLMWFAPTLNYLLVQLWQKEEDGDDHKLVIKAGSINNQPITNGG
ncbi:MAG: DUF3108 domain-containing protein [Gammaproteobacteria bacterium]|nr:MAG: DUF3108 domain-containing protein [Gammaproteobacteria bacterium]